MGLIGIKSKVARVFSDLAAVNFLSEKFCMVPNSCQIFDRRNVDDFPQIMVKFLVSPPGLGIHFFGHELRVFDLPCNFKARLEVYDFK